jgi:ubiquinone/menaquinone biosynthesis C-methylase UbiE
MPPEYAGLPIEAMIRESELQADSQVLELGIGTGRIAIPLAERIRRVSGVDLSRPMMETLKNKMAGTSVRIDVAQADVVHLPFPDERFDLIYAVHVLHLVNGWRAAVAEARRALKSGGYVFINWHRRIPDSPNALLRKELRRLAEARGVNTRRPGAQSEEEIREELGWAAETRIVKVREWTEKAKPAEILDELDQQLYSETWMIPRALMDAIMPELRRWAGYRFGGLDRAIEVPADFNWLIARK